MLTDIQDLAEFTKLQGLRNTPFQKTNGTNQPIYGTEYRDISSIIQRNLDEVSSKEQNFKDFISKIIVNHCFYF